MDKIFLTQKQRDQWVKDAEFYKKNLPKVPDYSEPGERLTKIIEKTRKQLRAEKDPQALRVKVNRMFKKIEKEILSIEEENNDLRTLGKEWYVFVLDILKITNEQEGKKRRGKANERGNKSN